jgi:hypothetical protein
MLVTLLSDYDKIFPLIFCCSLLPVSLAKTLLVSFLCNYSNETLLMEINPNDGALMVHWNGIFLKEYLLGYFLRGYCKETSPNI